MKLVQFDRWEAGGVLCLPVCVLSTCCVPNPKLLTLYGFNLHSNPGLCHLDKEKIDHWGGAGGGGGGMQIQFTCGNTIQKLTS